MEIDKTCDRYEVDFPRAPYRDPPPANTAPHLLVMTDPRPAMQLIKKRVELYPYNGTIPQDIRRK